MLDLEKEKSVSLAKGIGVFAAVYCGAYSLFFFLADQMPTGAGLLRQLGMTLVAAAVTGAFFASWHARKPSSRETLRISLGALGVVSLIFALRLALALDIRSFEQLNEMVFVGSSSRWLLLIPLWFALVVGYFVIARSLQQGAEWMCDKVAATSRVIDKDI